MNSKPVKDEQLLILFAQGNKEAKKLLFDRYYKIAKGAIYNTMQGVSKIIEKEHYELYFYEIFIRMVYEYNPKICSFRAYFNTAINRTLKGQIYRDANSPTKICISLNESSDEKNELIDLLEDENEINPSDALTNHEINLVLNSPLSKTKINKNELQRRILKMRYEGYKLKEIADELNVSITTAKRYLSNSKHGTPLSKIKIQFK